MSLNVIELDPAETFGSLRDRLLRAGKGRVVLLPSSQGDVLEQGINLVLLRRLMERERLEIGLVTPDRVLAARARALGLPAFSSLMLAEHYQPGWWRVRRPRERLGFAPGEAARVSGMPAVSARPVFAGALGLFLLALMLVASALLFMVPRATIVLRPATRPLQVISEITVDPSLVGAAADSLPAKEIRSTQTWEAFAEPTADPARDRSVMRAQTLQGLGASAGELLSPHVTPGTILVPGTTRFEVIGETFDREQDNRLHLALQIELTGMTVNQADVNQLALEQLTALLPVGFVVLPETGALEVQELPGRPDAFQLTARATGKARLDEASIKQAIYGQRIETVNRYLASSPLASPAEIAIHPAWWMRWFQRLPLLAKNIHIETLP